MKNKHYISEDYIINKYLKKLNFKKDETFDFKNDAAYLKIPKKLTGNEGAIKFALYGYDYPVKKKLPSIIYTPKEFDLVLFQ